MLQLNFLSFTNFMYRISFSHGHKIAIVILESWFRRRLNNNSLYTFKWVSILRVPISFEYRFQFTSDGRMTCVPVENRVVQYKRHTSSICEVISRPVRRSYECCIICYHVFVVIDSGIWNFPLFFIRWYDKSAL